MQTADGPTTANDLAYKARSTTPSQRPSCACEARAAPGTRPHRLGLTPTCGFDYEWNRYFRGELPIKNDIDVTEADRQRCNLILFGDPGSNKLLREALPALPIGWTERELEMAGGVIPWPITPQR